MMKVVVADDAQDRVAAGRSAVRAEQDRLPVRGELHRARESRFAWKFAYPPLEDWT